MIGMSAVGAATTGRGKQRDGKEEHHHSPFGARDLPPFG